MHQYQRSNAGNFEDFWNARYGRSDALWVKYVWKRRIEQNLFSMRSAASERACKQVSGASERGSGKVLYALISEPSY